MQGLALPLNYCGRALRGTLHKRLVHALTWGQFLALLPATHLRCAGDLTRSSQTISVAQCWCPRVPNSSIGNKSTINPPFRTSCAPTCPFPWHLQPSATAYFAGDLRHRKLWLITQPGQAPRLNWVEGQGLSCLKAAISAALRGVFATDADTQNTSAITKMNVRITTMYLSPREPMRMPSQAQAQRNHHLAPTLPHESLTNHLENIATQIDETNTAGLPS